MRQMLFDALADPTRQRVLEQLARGGPQRAGELSKALGVSPPVMSRHLKLLVTAGLLQDERVQDDARMRFFRLQPEGIAAAQAFLDQLQMDWRQQLRSFKAHVEVPSSAATTAPTSKRAAKAATTAKKTKASKTPTSTTKTTNPTKGAER